MATPAISLTFRQLYLEDLSASGVVAQTTDTVLGVGPGTTVTPFFTASGDAGAAAIGLTIGDIYIDTSRTPHRLRTRMT